MLEDVVVRLDVGGRININTGRFSEDSFGFVSCHLIRQRTLAKFRFLSFQVN